MPSKDTQFQPRTHPYCLKGHNTDVVGRADKNYCKECQKIKQLKYRYGITYEDYNKLFNKQNGLCAGCYRHQAQFKRRLNVDHDHKTGKVRGLLCMKCNTLLGFVEDDPQILQRLQEYLRRNNNV